MKKAPFLHIFIVLAFIANTFGTLPKAQADDFVLPKAGVMLHLSPPMNPPILKGIKVHTDNPFRFDFILDKGESNQNNDQLKEESSKLIKYFLASLTIPEKDLWVNLSPYEKDRIVPQSFGVTEMGRDLLVEDYMLKQITASLIYPEDEVGKKFWKRIYEEAQKRYGSTNIPVNTFNKVWIVPEKAVVYENAKVGAAYVVESKLKVMLEQDYLSLQKHSVTTNNDTSTLGSQIVREIVIPELTKEVNEDKNFVQLRQVYNSLILATWYKKKIKDSILSQVYADKSKVQGVNIDDPQEKEKIYRQYLKAFKKGVYNYIKEDVDPVTRETVPRKYFSGGIDWVGLTSTEATRLSTGGKMTFVHTISPAMLSDESSHDLRITAEVLRSNERKLELNQEPLNDLIFTMQVKHVRRLMIKLETWDRIFRAGFLFAKKRGFTGLMKYFAKRHYTVEHPAKREEAETDGFDFINGRLNENAKIRAGEGVVYYPGIGQDISPIFRIHGIQTLVGVDPINYIDFKTLRTNYEMGIIANGGEILTVQDTLNDNGRLMFEFKDEQGAVKKIILYIKDALKFSPDELSSGYDIFFPRSIMATFDAETVKQEVARLRIGGLFFLNEEPVTEFESLTRITTYKNSLGGLKALWVKGDKAMISTSPLDVKKDIIQGFEMYAEQHDKGFWTDFERQNGTYLIDYLSSANAWQWMSTQQRVEISMKIAQFIHAMGSDTERLKISTATDKYRFRNLYGIEQLTGRLFYNYGLESFQKVDDKLNNLLQNISQLSSQAHEPVSSTTSSWISKLPTWLNISVARYRLSSLAKRDKNELGRRNFEERQKDTLAIELIGKQGLKASPKDIEMLKSLISEPSGYSLLNNSILKALTGMGEDARSFVIDRLHKEGVIVRHQPFLDTISFYNRRLLD